MKRWYRRRRRRAAVALRESQWLLPAIGMILGAMLALALGTFDRNPDPNDWAITVLLCCFVVHASAPLRLFASNRPCTFSQLIRLRIAVRLA